MGGKGGSSGNFGGSGGNWNNSGGDFGDGNWNFYWRIIFYTSLVILFGILLRLCYQQLEKALLEFKHHCNERIARNPKNTKIKAYVLFLNTLFGII